MQLLLFPVGSQDNCRERSISKALPSGIAVLIRRKKTSSDINFTQFMQKKKAHRRHEHSQDLVHESWWVFPLPFLVLLAVVADLYSVCYTTFGYGQQSVSMAHHHCQNLHRALQSSLTWKYIFCKSKTLLLNFTALQHHTNVSNQLLKQCFHTVQLGNKLQQKLFINTAVKVFRKALFYWVNWLIYLKPAITAYNMKSKSVALAFKANDSALHYLAIPDWTHLRQGHINT